MIYSAMQNIKISYSFFQQQKIFENLLAGPLKLEGPLVATFLAYI
jgi:hypothetical protein